MSLAVAGTAEMPWGETIHLVRQLASDPASHTYASVQRWPNPVSREWLLLADIYDLLTAVNSTSRPKPYPRPFDPTKVRSEVPRISQARIRAELAKRGH